MRVKYACIVTKVEGKKGIEEIQRMTSKQGGGMEMKLGTTGERGEEEVETCTKEKKRNDEAFFVYVTHVGGDTDFFSTLHDLPVWGRAI